MNRHQLRDESLVREYHTKVDCSACGKTLELWGVTQSGTDDLLCPECVSPDRSGTPPTTKTPQREQGEGFLEGQEAEVVDPSTAPERSGNTGVAGGAGPNYARRVGVQAEFDREFHKVYDWPSETLPVETSPR